MKKNNKGSALVWVLVICLIFAVLGISLGWVALSMHQRSIDLNRTSQSYLTVRSGTDLLFDYLNGDPEKYAFSKELRSNLIEKAAGSSSVSYPNVFKSVSDGSNSISGLGNCEVKASYNAGKITIKATSDIPAAGTSQAQSDTLQLTATRVQNQIWPAKLWASTTNVWSGTNDFSAGAATDRPVDEAVDFTVYQVKDGANGSVTFKETATTNSTGKLKYKNQAIFLYIDDNAKVTIKDFSFENSTKWDANSYPDIFIDVGKNAKLTLVGGNTTAYPFYLRFEEGSGAATTVSGTTAKVYSYVAAGVTSGKLSDSLVFESKTVKSSSGLSTITVPSRSNWSSYSYKGEPCSNTASDTAKGAAIVQWEKGDYTSSSSGN